VNAGWRLRSVGWLAWLLAMACSDARSPPGRRADSNARPDTLRAVDSLIQVGDSLYQDGQYAAANATWTSVMLLVRQAGAPATEARLLTSAGLARWRLGEYDSAWALVDEARRLEEAQRLDALMPRTYNALGLIAWDMGRLREAADLFQRTVAAAVAVGDPEYPAKAGLNLGNIQADLGDFSRARSAFLASLAAGRELESAPLELRSLVNLAMVSNRTGDPAGALAWLDSAARRGIEEDPPAEDNYRSQLAHAAWALGDPGRALAALDSAVHRSQSAGVRQSEAANLTLMADIYRDAGDLTRSLDLYAQAEEIHRELDLPTERGNNLASQAAILGVLSRHDAALAFGARALALHQQSGARSEELDDHLLMAEVAALASDGPASRSHLAAAGVLARALDTRRARLQYRLTEARIADGLGHGGDILRSLAAVGPDLELAGYAHRAEVEALRARSFARGLSWDSAIAAGRRAVEVLERVRGRYRSGVLRASFAGLRAGIYGELAAALLATGRASEAFRVTEAARAVALGIGTAEVGGGTASGDNAAVRRDRQLSRLTTLIGAIERREEDGLDTGELVAELRRAERDYEFATLHAATGIRSGPGDVPATVGIGPVLEPDEAVVAYLVAPERLIVFVVRSDRVVGRELRIAASALEGRVRLARGMLDDPTIPPEEADPVLRALATELLEPVMGELAGVRRLAVVPHGVLNYLPFAALPAPGGGYLVQRYVLLHVPSVAHLVELRRLIPGKPDLAARISVTAFAPRPGDLPATLREVEAIGDVLGGVRILVGRRASEKAVRRALGESGVVHLASHGVLNRENPLFSRIELGGRGGPHGSDDGRLEIHEVLALRIGSPLVFLSGCETALGPGSAGQFAPGEDYQTLASAFLQAGARSVIATLWPVADAGAAAFAERFYRRLASEGPAEALAEAQRGMLGEPRYRHPYYWAGYRLTGNGRPATDLTAATAAQASR